MTRWTLVVAFHVSSVYKTIQPWWMACRFTLTQRCSHRMSNFHMFFFRLLCFCNGIVTAAGLCTGPIPVHFCGLQPDGGFMYALIRWTCWTTWRKPRGVVGRKKTFSSAALAFAFVGLRSVSTPSVTFALTGGCGQMSSGSTWEVDIVWKSYYWPLWVFHASNWMDVEVPSLLQRSQERLRRHSSTCLFVSLVHALAEKEMLWWRVNLKCLNVTCDWRMMLSSDLNAVSSVTATCQHAKLLHVWMCVTCFMWKRACTSIHSGRCALWQCATEKLRCAFSSTWVDLFRVDVTLMGFISHDQEERMQAKQSQTDAGKHSQMWFLPPFLTGFWFFCHVFCNWSLCKCF